MSPRLILTAGALMELGYLSFYMIDDPAQEVLLFFLVHSVAYLLLSFLLVRSGAVTVKGLTSSASGSHHERAGRRTILLVVGFGILFRVTLLVHSPVASDDIYRYVWDGRVAEAGMNPFRYAPVDTALAPLRTVALPARVNFPEMRTIYPPLAQGAFFLSNVLFGDSVTGMKFLFFLADLATIILLVLLVRTRGDAGGGGAVWPLVLYAWSPVPILYFALDGHVDVLGLPLLLLFLLAASNTRPVRSAIALGLAALAKLYPLLLAPFLLQLRNRRWAVVVPVLMLAAGYLWYYEPTGGIYESFFVYNTNFAFNGALYSVLRYAGLPGQAVRIACAAMLVLWIAFLFLRRRPLAETALLAFLGFLLCSPTAHPWYFSWLALLVAVRWSPSVFVLVGLTGLTNLIVYQQRVTGVWSDQPFLLILEYLPFACVFAYEIWAGRLLRGPAGLPA